MYKYFFSLCFDTHTHTCVCLRCVCVYKYNQYWLVFIHIFVCAYEKKINSSLIQQVAALARIYNSLQRFLCVCGHVITICGRGVFYAGFWHRGEPGFALMATGTGCMIACLELQVGRLNLGTVIKYDHLIGSRDPVTQFTAIMTCDWHSGPYCSCKLRTSYINSQCNQLQSPTKLTRGGIR